MTASGGPRQPRYSGTRVPPGRHKMPKMKARTQKLLAVFLAIELSTDELSALTVACLGAPRLNRVAEAAEEAIKSRDAGEAQIDRMALINLILDDEVVIDDPEDDDA